MPINIDDSERMAKQGVKVEPGLSGYRDELASVRRMLREIGA